MASRAAITVQTRQAQSPSAIIVGTGLMGRWHARAATRAGARIAGVVDSDQGRAHAVAKQYPGCLVATGIDGLELQGGVFVAHICTPTPTHALLAKSCIGRGWHSLIEKPIADSAPVVEGLLRQADNAGLLLCPSHQFLYQRGIRKILARRLDFGDIVQVRAIVSSAGASAQGVAARAIALEILPHPLSIVERLVPDGLERLQWRGVSSGCGDLAIVGGDGLITATISISTKARPTINEIHISGTRASARADLFHGFAVIESGTVSRRRKVGRPFGLAAALLTAGGWNLVRRAAARQPAYPGLWELVDAFYTAVRGGTPSPILSRETLSVARAYDSIQGALRPIT